MHARRAGIAQGLTSGSGRGAKQQWRRRREQQRVQDAEGRAGPNAGAATRAAAAHTQPAEGCRE
jgi:hypothetical protein